MRKFQILFFLLIVTSVYSCRKCKECYLEETNTSTGNVTTTSLGEKCGDDLENTDGKTYNAAKGPVRTYCE